MHIQQPDKKLEDLQTPYRFRVSTQLGIRPAVVYRTFEKSKDGDDKNYVCRVQGIGFVDQFEGSMNIRSLQRMIEGYINPDLIER